MCVGSSRIRPETLAPSPEVTDPWTGREPHNRKRPHTEEVR